MRHAPLPPTPEMIDAGAKALVSWENGSVWPDSWGADAHRHRRDAEKVYWAMLAQAPERPAADASPIEDSPAWQADMRAELQLYRDALLYQIRIDMDDMSEEALPKAERLLEQRLAAQRARQQR